MIAAEASPTLGTIGAKVHGASRTVLVVDDQPVQRLMAARLVERIQGLVARSAESAITALQILGGGGVSAVLTDLQMPEMDGLALVEEIRRQYPSVPVILMTAHGSEDLAVRALHAGASYYVPKRVLASNLAGALRAVLDGADGARRRISVLSSTERRSWALRLPNDPGLIDSTSELLLGQLDDLCEPDANERLRLGVALREALTNAIYHGNLEVDSDLRQSDDERPFHELAARRREQEPYRSRRVTVEVEVDRGSARFVIGDEGPGFDTSRLERPIDPEELLRIGGRGLLLMRAFADEVSYNATGSQVTLVKRWPSRSAEGSAA